MAAITDWDDYAARLTKPGEIIQVAKPAMTTIAGRMYEYFIPATLGGAAPTAPVVPTRATTGAVGQQNAGSEQSYLLAATLATTQAGTYILCDRLSHMGGLDATVTTANVTTNLPTAALTRYTDGEGVMMFVSIYTQIGASSTTISVTYTNEANTGSRVSPGVAFGNTGYREINRVIIMPFQSGDTGVRSIQSYTIAATTGTAGAFGFTLFKPLYGFHVDRAGGQVDFSLVDGGVYGGLPEIVDDACLFWMALPAGNTAGTTTGIFGSLPFVTV